MSAKEYSLLIEIELRKINTSMYGKSDEILFNPYEEIISAIQFRVPQKELEKFKSYYQCISNRTLQELIDEDYNITRLLKDLRNLIENDKI